MDNLNLFTCKEIIERHRAVNTFDWNAAKVGTFYNCFLLCGKRFGEKRTRVSVTDASFKNLLTYALNLRDSPEQLPVFMAYEEVIEEFPCVDNFNWTPTVIGIFYHSGLLSGKKSKKEGRHLVTEQSVINLIRYTSQRFVDVLNMPRMQKGA